MNKFLLSLTLIVLLSKFGIAQTHPKKPAPKPIAATNSVSDKEPYLNPGDVGTVSFTYQGKPVRYTTVRAKDGNIWLQQNLGSKKVAAKLDDKDSYGDLFQWGRWDDGHQLVVEPANTRRMELKPNNPSGLNKSGSNPFYYEAIATWWLSGTSRDTWNAETPQDVNAINGCDPCKAIGAGWHLPSMDEMKKAWEMEYVTDNNGGILSNLKLPLAGYRHYYTADLMHSRGKSAGYWTSSVQENSGIFMQLSSGPLTAFRGMGLSIRCLKSANYKAVTGAASKIEKAITAINYPYYYDPQKKTYIPLLLSVPRIVVKQKALGWGGRQFIYNIGYIEEMTPIAQADSVSFYLRNTDNAQHNTAIYPLTLNADNSYYSPVGLEQKIAQKDFKVVNAIPIKIITLANGLVKIAIGKQLPKGNYMIASDWLPDEQTATAYLFKIY